MTSIFRELLLRITGAPALEMSVLDTVLCEETHQKSYGCLKKILGRNAHRMGCGQKDLGWCSDAGCKCCSFSLCFQSEESAEGLKRGGVAEKIGL